MVKLEYRRAFFPSDFSSGLTQLWRVLLTGSGPVFPPCPVAMTKAYDVRRWRWPSSWAWPVSCRRACTPWWAGQTLKASPRPECCIDSGWTLLVRHIHTHTHSLTQLQRCYHTALVVPSKTQHSDLSCDTKITTVASWMFMLALASAAG